jgi:hypothetical protein
MWQRLPRKVYKFHKVPQALLSGRGCLNILVNIQACPAGAQQG